MRVCDHKKFSAAKYHSSVGQLHMEPCRERRLTNFKEDLYDFSISMSFLEELLVVLGFLRTRHGCRELSGSLFFLPLQS